MQELGVVNLVLMCSEIAGGIGHLKGNWGHIGKDYHLKRLNVKADCSVINRPLNAHWEFSLPAAYRTPQPLTVLQEPRSTSYDYASCRLACHLGFVGLEDTMLTFIYYFLHFSRGWLQEIWFLWSQLCIVSLIHLSELREIWGWGWLSEVPEARS